MPAVPCANHPKEMTLVRCGRCETPICVRCMVDSPVGKKCRDCARNRVHINESSPRQVLLSFAAATVVALPAGLLMYTIPFLFISAFAYGWVVAQVALWAGQRRRSLAMQVATGIAALIGGLPGWLLPVYTMLSGRADAAEGLPVMGLPAIGYPLAMTAIGVAVAVSRVRFQ